MLRYLVPLLAACVALAPAAQARATFEGQFEQTGSTHMDGLETVRGLSPAIDLKLNAQDLVSLEANSVRRMDFNSDEVIVVTSVLRPLTLHNEPLPPAEKDLHYAGPLTLAFPTEGFAVIRYIPTPGTPLQFTLSGKSQTDPPGSWKGLPPEAAMAHVQAFGEIDLHPDTSGALFIADGNMTVRLGSGFLIVDGPTAILPTERISTGYSTDNATSVSDPVTGSSRQASSGTLVMVAVDSMSLQCTACEATSQMDDFAGELEGQILWHGVQGTNSVNNSALPSDLELLESGGKYTWTVHPTQGGMQWRVQGQADWVNANSSQYWRATTGVLTGVALVAIGALALGGFKGLATFILGRHTPALAKAPLFDGETRLQILKAIHQFQPATLGRLRETTGLSRGNLRYHLRILESHDVLQSVLPSGHKRRERCFMLNSGSLMFKAAGLSFTGEGNEQEASGRILSAVNTDQVRSSILTLLLAKGPMAADQIRAALQENGIVTMWPRSTASYQLKKMVASKALREQRQGLVKVYSAEIDPMLARKRQYSSYFIQSGNQPVAEALAAGPKTIDELVLALARQGKDSKGIKEKLAKLCGLALITKDQDGRFHLGASVPPHEGVGN